MKARFISRVLVQSSLLISLVSCSDATQFAETTLPAALDASKPADGTTATEESVTTYDSTSPMGQVLAKPDSTSTATAAPNTGASGTGSNGGVGTGSGSTGTGSTGNTGGSTATGSTGTGSGGTGTGGAGAPATTTPIFSVCEGNANLAIVSQLYKLPAETSKLPDFSTMRSEGDVCNGMLNIADRDFTQGFPGVSEIFEWFALDMRFKVTITAPGTYEFFLNSDDGSILSIDGSKVIDNDGTHSQLEKSGSKYLGVGVHDFRVRYYQGPRTRIALELFWKKPGTSNKVYIPANVMSRP